MRFDLNKLEILMEAVRRGNYSAAARQLHLTPSAVSHAVAKLEAGLGFDLVEWRGRELVLTDEGRLLYETCERVFPEVYEAEARILGGRAEKALVLGATVEFGSSVLVRKLRPLLEAHPELRVDFYFSHELAQPLLRDEIDLAVDCLPHTDPGVECAQLFRERYAVVASPAFLARHRVRSPLDLERVPVLSLDKGGEWWRNMMGAVEPGRRPAFRRVVAVNHVRGMINAALAGYGAAFLPKYCVLGELSRGRLKALFPRLRLLDDRFCLYQKRSRASREKNQLLTRFLKGLKVDEFGDALT